MSGSPSLLIRVDGSSDIGSGHVMRCLTLGEEWAVRGGGVHVVSVVLSELLEERLARAGFRVHRINAAGEIEEVKKLVAELEAGWLVLDSYHFDESYFRQVAMPGTGLLVFDDYGHAMSYPVDLILNQNGGDAKLYANRAPWTRTLIGAKFALVRSDLRGAKRRGTSGAGRSVLVMMGGADPLNVTRFVVESLKHLADVNITAVCGPANTHYDALTRSFAGNANVRLIRNPSNLPELMAACDVCVSATGSSVYELLCMGVPSVFIRIADNQLCVEETVKFASAGVALGDHRTLDGGRIAEAVSALFDNKNSAAELADRGRATVDGHGVVRVVDAMLAKAVRLRSVVPDDAKLLWEWANDPGVRERAFHPEPIPWEDHVQWFERGFASDERRHFIGLDALDRPVGQVRFDRADACWEIDISVSGDRHGCGNGAKLLALGLDRMLEKDSKAVFRASVLEGNTASIRLFRDAGFGEIKEIDFEGRRAAIFEKKPRGVKVFLVAGCRPWCREAFDELSRNVSGDWRYVSSVEELNAAVSSLPSRSRIFFLHWSWKIPAEIFEQFECIGFHMTDLPYGRGGSPLQNLILRGHESTMLSAFRVGEEMDAGPVYLKRPLSLEGSAREIFEKAMNVASAMIIEIVERDPVPCAQSGDVVLFKRRRPEDSEIPEGLSGRALYDFIRMLDAEGYPRAFARTENGRREFSNARLEANGSVSADVTTVCETGASTPVREAL